MLKHNPSVTDTKPNPDDTADKENSKIHLLFCIRCRGDSTQAATNEKIQWLITKCEYKSVWF